MQYKNYLPYTYIHGEPTTRTQRAFSFSLKGGKKKKNSQTPWNVLVTKSGYLQETIFYL